MCEEEWGGDDEIGDRRERFVTILFANYIFNDAFIELFLDASSGTSGFIAERLGD